MMYCDTVVKEIRRDGLFLENSKNRLYLSGSTIFADSTKLPLIDKTLIEKLIYCFYFLYQPL